MNIVSHPRQIAIANESRAMVRLAVKGLPPKQRDIVLGEFWFHKSDREIARLLGCAHTGINYQRRKAMGQLRNALAALAGMLLLALPVQADQVYVNLITLTDPGAHTWTVEATVTGDLSRTTGLAGIEFTEQALGGLTITSSTCQMPAAWDIFRSDGVNGVNISGAELPLYSNYVTGWGISAPVTLASGTYSGDNGQLTSFAWPSTVTLSVAGQQATIFPDAVTFRPADELMGDANGDGVVDFTDFALLSNNFGSTQGYWQIGDFNGDGLVNAADFTLLSNNYSATWEGVMSGASAPASGVPEPATLAMMTFGLLFFRSKKWHSVTRTM